MQYCLRGQAPKAGTCLYTYVWVACTKLHAALKRSVVLVNILQIDDPAYQHGALS